ncbi:glycosyl transferases group 1 family protein [Burkholderia thailandensis E254]|uniref:glycosyltransferase n=1 Tax=Burkholderia thailandensis TaxID=57975 RepID=UPI000517B79B|nr:glycosyltransferase [Burkholderia thailandensis]AIT24181.1 glycosyl transferases group 1 family protein [Burkholderia thailandensis E254]PNE71527.1 glycosyl transferase [Burkholderia thailandensis]
MIATKVHVHLFYGADPRTYRKGDGIGCLYGYHHAESEEFALTYSRDARESRLVGFGRRALKYALGFDLMHAWRNRAELLDSDVIWTHTEHEHLAAALVLKLFGARGAKPLLLAQSVWLLDKWPGYGFARRWAYRKLIGRADVLTTLARNNAELCRRYLRRDALQVYYGLNTQDFPICAPDVWSPHRPLRIAAIGNDRDRDWKTFVAAFGGDSRYEVRLATRRRIPRALHAPNVEIAPASGIVEQRELYDWADLIVVPLRPNHHASGITVMLEAAALGKPMIVSDVGGLRDYFPQGAATYVQPFDALALRRAADALAARPDQALARAQAAARRLRERDLTTQQFAAQHVRITRDLLTRRRAHAAAEAALSFADSRSRSNG